MNHKRRRPKNRRAGCLLCKPHKSNGRKDQCESQTWQERRARIGDAEIDVSPAALAEARAMERLAEAERIECDSP